MSADKLAGIVGPALRPVVGVIDQRDLSHGVHWRLSAGDYRLVYTAEGVRVIAAGLRREHGAKGACAAASLESGLARLEVPPAPRREWLPYPDDREVEQ